MEELHAILAELEQSRERASGLIRAKLAAIAEQLREAAARAESDLDLVLPPDPEAFFSLGQVSALLEASQPPPAPPAVDRELVAALDRGRAQSEVLQEMLRRLAPWCGRRAVLVFREGKANGWAGAGFEGDDPTRTWQGQVGASPALSRAAAGVPVVGAVATDAVLAGWLGDGATRVAVVPMALRGNVVGALLAAAEDDRLDVEPIQVVVYLTGLLLETLTVRGTVPTPALRAPEVLEVEREAAEAPATAFAAAAEPEAAIAVPEPAPEPRVEVAPAPVVTPKPAEEPSRVAAVDDASATMQLAVPITPEPRLRTAEQERKHEEARRFARLLVSEIRLYNEQAVGEGKANRDIYLRLKEDIDRSREMYEQRVAPEIRAESNYFFDELVRILAEGDPDALGL